LIYDPTIDSYNWAHLQPLLAFKIQQLVDNFPGDSTFSSPDAKASLTDSIMTGLNSFKQYVLFNVKVLPFRAPFTLQRLCELLYEPTKYYRKLERVLLSIEKCLNVRTTLPTVENVSTTNQDAMDTQMSENTTQQQVIEYS
jgi:serine/threonine-protein phosphatase 4 regulatory subunit 2